ncbi:MAG: hypothetical protein SFX18_06585 [Pirellulales bacterium]|nr:hypothetical protein [Pirellulales bacterium]
MGHRWFAGLVVAFWVTSMGWLLVTKLLPPLQMGEPPSYRSIYGNAAISRPRPVGWQMTWRDKPMGWAVTHYECDDQNYTTVQSHVHFDFLPVDELLPVLFRGLWDSRVRGLGKIHLDADSKIVIDPHGLLQSLSFHLTSPELPEPIRVTGQLRNEKLQIVIFNQSQQFTKLELPGNVVLGNDLSPMSRLPGLTVGQTWTVPIYSPFRVTTSSPVEMYQATVERRDILLWQNDLHPVLVVTMRPDSGALGTNQRRPRARLWVDEMGQVLLQESFIQNFKLAFTRANLVETSAMWAKSQAHKQQRLRETLDLEPNAQALAAVNVWEIPDWALAAQEWEIPTAESAWRKSWRGFQGVLGGLGPEKESALPADIQSNNQKQPGQPTSGKETPSVWKSILRGGVRWLPRESIAPSPTAESDAWDAALESGP